MAVNALTRTGYAEKHRQLFEQEREAVQGRLNQIQKELLAGVQETLAETDSSRVNVNPYWMSTALPAWFHSRIRQVAEQLEGAEKTTTYKDNGVPDQKYGDEELARVTREFEEANTGNDAQRLMAILESIKPHTKQLKLSPIEMERLTLDLDGNQHKTTYWTPAELMSKRVLVPYDELINYLHEDEIPLRVCPVERYMQQPISLQRTGTDDVQQSALYQVVVTYGDEPRAHKHPLQFSVPQDQEDLWLALFDENLQELVQRQLSPYFSDPLGKPQDGTMKIPLAKVKEGKNVSEFNVNWCGAGVRTFNSRLLSEETRNELHFSAEEVRTKLTATEEDFQETMPKGLCDTFYI